MEELIVQGGASEESFSLLHLHISTYEWVDYLIQYAEDIIMANDGIPVVSLICWSFFYVKLHMFRGTIN